MIEPPLQPWQPVHFILERAQLLLGSEEAEGVDLPPDHVINPRHLATSSLGGPHRVSPDSHTLSGGISGAETGEVTALPSRHCLLNGVLDEDDGVTCDDDVCGMTRPRRLVAGAVVFGLSGSCSGCRRGAHSAVTSATAALALDSSTIALLSA
jgi:hypothetical protein